MKDLPPPKPDIHVVLQRIIVDSINRAVQLGNNQIMYMGNPYVHAAGGELA